MINVITLSEGVINTNTIFLDKDGDMVLRAEERFGEECRKLDPTLHDSTISELLDDGYFESGNGTVCISHPTVDGEGE